MSITKVKRAKRLQLSKMQTRIEEESCANCEYNASKYHTSACEGCPAFKQLRNIGQELLNLSTAKKSSEPQKNSNRNFPPHSPDRNYKPVMTFMTWELYYEHKNKGLKDNQIAELLGVNKSTLRNWKHRNLLTKPDEVQNHE